MNRTDAEKRLDSIVQRARMLMLEMNTLDKYNGAVRLINDLAELLRGLIEQLPEDEP